MIALHRQLTALLLGLSSTMAPGDIQPARAASDGVTRAQAVVPPDEGAAEAGEPSPPAREKSSRKVRALRQATFLLVVLVLIFAISLLAFRRWSKHYRARLLRDPHEATPADDVWAMHRLPRSEEGTGDAEFDAAGEDDGQPEDDRGDEGDESR